VKEEGASSWWLYQKKNSLDGQEKLYEEQKSNQRQDAGRWFVSATTELYDKST